MWTCIQYWLGLNNYYKGVVTLQPLYFKNNNHNMKYFFKNFFVMSFLVPFFNLATTNLIAQEKKVSYTVFALSAKQMPTNYIVDSGSANLVSRKNTNGLQVGVNIDFKLNKKWSIRTGYSMHGYSISETNYGASGNLPSNITGEGWIKYLPKYLKGAEYFERFAHSFPLKLMRKMNTKKNDYNISAGLQLSFYNKTRDELIRTTILLDNPNGGYTPMRKYEITRDFEDNQRLFLGLSVPKIEWQFDAETVFKLKKKGGIVLGLKATLATQNLERANFIIWPYESNYRSKGHYTLTRSYFGLYAGYRF